MRTTLDIDDDVLQAVKELAAARGSSAGRTLSDLARRALRPATKEQTRNGVPLLLDRPGSGVVTVEHVARLLDETL
jgi:cell pole-organizing protein PopZ